MNSFNKHKNLSQHASEPRSPPTTCESLHGHASWRNQSMSILIISINRILRKYFKSQQALVFDQFKTDFSVENHITTTIGTNGPNFKQYWILLIVKATPVGESSYMVIYLDHGMFI